jgi:hypothetical protein
LPVNDIAWPANDAGRGRGTLVSAAFDISLRQHVPGSRRMSDGLLA